MAKEEGIQLEAEVIDLLPSAMFKVRLDNGNVVVAYLGGKLRNREIKILLGDRVRIECSPYDFTKGRIIYRL